MVTQHPAETPQISPDANSLAMFFEEYQERLVHYSHMLQAIVTGAEHRNWHDAAQHTDLVDQALLRMRPNGSLSQAPIWEFLESQRVPDGPVELGQYTGTCAHDLARQAMFKCAEFWQECKLIAKRHGSRSHSSPCELFKQGLEAIPGLILQPPALYVHLLQERLRIEQALEARTTVRAPEPPEVRAPAPGLSWHVAMERAENHVKRNGGVFPGRNTLAKVIGCSRSTMTKVVARSRYLSARRAESKCLQADPRRAAQLLGSDAQRIADPSAESTLDTLIAEQAADQRRERRQHAAALRRR